MNFEDKLKTLIGILIILATIASLFISLLFTLPFFFPLMIFSLGIFGAIILELYLRIQHNIDNHFQELKQKIKGNKQELKNEFKENNKALKQKIEESNKELKNLEKTLQKIMKLFDTQTQRLNKFGQLLIKTYWFSAKQDRMQSLLKLASDIFNHKSVLYIGARINRFDFAEEFRKSNYEISVLEIHKPNIDYLKNITWLKEVIHGDIKTFKSKKKYDVIFWWHGPEHINKKDLKKTLKKIESMSKKMVVLGCPWGKVEQGEKYGNPYEKHRSFFDIGYFENLGYKTTYLGERDIMGSSIIAVKSKNK